MLEKCPGQDKRNIRQESTVCNACGYEIEIFSDELKARCPRCRNVAHRKVLPSCTAWCSSAGICRGDILKTK